MIHQAIHRPIHRLINRSIAGADPDAGKVYAGRPNGTGYATAGDNHDVTGTGLNIRMRVSDFDLTANNKAFIGKSPSNGSTGYSVVTRINGLRFWCGLNNVWTTLTITGLTAPPAGEEWALWFRYNGALMEWGFQGVKQPQNTPATDPISSAAGNDFNIGAPSNADVANKLAVTIRDLRIDKRALTDQENEDWALGLEDLVGDVCDYSINEGNGLILNDRTSGINANVTLMTEEEFWVAAPKG